MLSYCSRWKQLSDILIYTHKDVCVVNYIEFELTGYQGW